MKRKKDETSKDDRETKKIKVDMGERKCSVDANEDKGKEKATKETTDLSRHDPDVPEVHQPGRTKSKTKDKGHADVAAHKSSLDVTVLHTPNPGAIGERVSVKIAHPGPMQKNEEMPKNKKKRASKLMCSSRRATKKTMQNTGKPGHPHQEE